MSRSAIIGIISFLLYLTFQVVLLKNVVLFHTAFCFVYLAFLLLLPIETNPMVLMFLGLGTGILVDMFYDSLGLHAASTVFIMFLRNHWLGRLTPQGGYDSNDVPGLGMSGAQWFLIYATPLILVHHAVLFFTEAGGFHYFGFTLAKVIFSTLFTTFVIVLIQLLFPAGKRL